MLHRHILLASTCLALALFSSSAFADGARLTGDMRQVRYMLEKYAVNEPSTFCIRYKTLADVNPAMREEILREGRRMATRYAIDCDAAPVLAAVPAPAPAPVYVQPAPVYVQPAPRLYTPPAPLYAQQPAAEIYAYHGARFAGSHGSVFAGNSILWGGLGVLAAGGAAAALISTGGGGGTTGGGGDNFITDEYKAQYSLTTMDAASAYRRGFTGKGITVGLLDTGVDTTHFEMQGRIAPGGGYDFVNNTAGQPSPSDLFAHGTQVAGVIAANRNFIGMHGVAYDATILPVRVFNKTGGAISTSFAAAIDYVTNSGTRILNGSYGPDDNWHRLSESRGHQIVTSFDLSEGAAYQRAAAAGVILVFPTGNAYDIAPGVGSNPTGPGFLPFISPSHANITGAANGAYRDEAGNVLSTADFSSLASMTIAVAGVDKNNTILGFSNRCGVAKDWCMVAPAVDIFTTTVGGQYAVVTGTSYAAPQVSGAVAILKQEFPNLSPQQIIQRLFATATDLGAPGVDDVYGHGLINLAAASSPLGAVGISTTGLVDGPRYSLENSSLHYGKAFGANSALAFAGEQVGFSDSYGAVFSISAANLIHSSADTFDAAQAVFKFDRAPERQEIQVDDGLTIGFSARNNDDNESLLTGDAPKDKSDIGTQFSGLNMTQKISDTTEASLHYRDAESLSLGFTENDRARYDRAINKDAMMNPYAAFTSKGYASILKTEALGATIRVAGFYGHDYDNEAAQNFGSQVEAAYKLAKGSEAYFSVGSLFEENSVLGTAGNGAFAFGSGTTTLFTGIGTKLALDEKTTFRATGYVGYTDPSLADDSLITQASGLITTSFNMGVERRGIAQKEDTLSFGLSQPLRVESGNMNINMPVAFDFDTNRMVMEPVNQNLTAQGREMDMEVNYAFPIEKNEKITTGIMYRMDAGHVAGQDDALGVVRWSKKF